MDNMKYHHIINGNFIERPNRFIAYVVCKGMWRTGDGIRLLDNREWNGT